MTTTSASEKSRRSIAPEIIVAAGCLIAMITWGPRSAAGAMQLPVLETRGWSTEAYAFAFAVQNLLWGLGQPISGRLADAYGSQRVLIGGALLYALGVVLMTISTTPAAFTLTAGVIWGFGLSGCSITLIISGVGKMVPDRMRPLAFGLVGASGSFGQFVFSPLAGWLIEGWNWQVACVVFACMLGAIVPLSYLVASRSMKDSSADNGGAADESWWTTLRDAMRDRSYMLVVIGFFTCGFQLAFITVHFQRYVVESGLSANVGYWAFALVGLFNVAGSIGSGSLCQRYPSRYVLAGIYFSRSVITLVFINLAPSPIYALTFGALSGLLWLSTLAPTSAIVNRIFGPRNFGMLYGFAFLFHQVGSFFGVWLGGVARQQLGSYDLVWYFSIALGVASALISLPIKETPPKRNPQMAGAAAE
ncbi:MAG: MFS transporter [Beijerinckiaceae bacterium]